MAPMPLHLEGLKRYLGFGPAETKALAALAERIGPHLPMIAESFLAAARQDETAAAVLERSGRTPDELREMLVHWLADLFCGHYDAAYQHRRAAIGRAHQSLQVPQHYMCAGVSLIRAALTERIRALNPPKARLKTDALNKLLDLELAIMLDAYRDAAIEHIRSSERAAMKRQLQESEHLANVGQLAATLAHEIKNPLAGISGAVQVLGSALPPGNPHQEVVAEILSEIDRLDATARDLLIYARPKPPRRRRTAVGPFLQQILMQLRNQPAVEALPIRYDGLECAAEAFIDETQFRQVITNLLLNAAHACEGGGEVTFRLSSTDDTVRVEVIDTGVGIPADKLDASFEPFYTTKAKGTGLGLAICKWIVESHGGRIALASRLGQGTTVTIDLPSKR